MRQVYGGVLTSGHRHRAIPEKNIPKMLNAKTMGGMLSSIAPGKQQIG